MRFALALILIPLLALSTTSCARKAKKKDYARPLPDGALALREVDISTMPDMAVSDRAAVRRGIANSLAFLEKKSTFPQPIGGVEKSQVIASLKAIDELLTSTSSDEQFNAEVKKRFRAYMSIGCDDQGTVLFTGYYTPIFDASRTATDVYRYPIYKRPTDLVMTTSLEIAKQSPGMNPYPDASTIETSGMLKGQELVWMMDPYEAYLVRVQGSAKLHLPDGGQMEIGYAGTNGYQYKGIGQDLVKDGKIPSDKLSFFTIREFFRAHPEEVSVYTSRNPRYIFFTETKGGPFGSIGQPVTLDVSIATDKTIFPPGGPVVAATALSTGGEDQAKLKDAPNKGVTYVGLRLDQDTGGAIRAPGRCDLYMGEGEANERRAGGQYAEGKLYYLIVK
jgi:membrane-bound lytic murein transglycosylase A